MRRVRVEASESHSDEGEEERSAAEQTRERSGRGEREIRVWSVVEALTSVDIAYTS